MLEKIIEAEEAEMMEAGHHEATGRSGLRLFARLDVAFAYDQNKKVFSYWLNEIERSHTAALYSIFAREQATQVAPTMVSLMEKNLD